MRPSSICFFAGGVAGVEPPHEPHLEEHAGAARSPSCIAATSSSESAGGFSQNVGLPRCGRGDDQLAVRVRRADDDDRVDRRVVDERQRIGVVPRHVELGRDFLRQRSRPDRPRPRAAFRRCGSTGRARRRGPGGRAQSIQLPDVLSGDRHFTLSLVTSSSLTLMSAGTVSPRITLTALSTATRPISDGKLRHRRLHRPRRNRLLRIVERVEADDADLAGLAGGGDRLDRAERHQVAAGEHAVDVGVRLQHVLEHVEALVALPVRRLRRDDRDARRRP